MFRTSYASSAAAVLRVNEIVLIRYTYVRLGRWNAIACVGRLQGNCEVVYGEECEVSPHNTQNEQKGKWIPWREAMSPVHSTAGLGPNENGYMKCD
jgi:hypothetical protein